MITRYADIDYPRHGVGHLCGVEGCRIMAVATAVRVQTVTAQGVRPARQFLMPVRYCRDHAAAWLEVTP